MNQLEVGKVYKCINNVDWKCLSIRKERADSDQAIMETVDGKAVLWCSIYGTNRGGMELIAWPIKFKPGQLVMVRDGDDQNWIPGSFSSMVEDVFYCTGLISLTDVMWHQCRLPTDAEWIEFREGKK